MKSQSQGYLGEKKAVRVQPAACWVGGALNRVVADYRAGRTVVGPQPSLLLALASLL